MPYAVCNDQVFEERRTLLQLRELARMCRVARVERLGFVLQVSVWNESAWKPPMDIRARIVLVRAFIREVHDLYEPVHRALDASEERPTGHHNGALDWLVVPVLPTI